LKHTNRNTGALKRSAHYIHIPQARSTNLLVILMTILKVQQESN